MTKTLSLSEVRTRLPELVTGVQEREEEKEEVLVTRNVRRRRPARTPTFVPLRSATSPGSFGSTPVARPPTSLRGHVLPVCHAPRTTNRLARQCAPAGRVKGYQAGRRTDSRGFSTQQELLESAPRNVRLTAFFLPSPVPSARSARDERGSPSLFARLLHVIRRRGSAPHDVSRLKAGWTLSPAG